MSVKNKNITSDTPVEVRLSKELEHYKILYSNSLHTISQYQTLFNFLNDQPWYTAKRGEIDNYMHHYYLNEDKEL